MVNATDCRSVSWGFDSLPRLRYGFSLAEGAPAASLDEKLVDQVVALFLGVPWGGRG